MEPDAGDGPGGAGAPSIEPIDVECSGSRGFAAISGAFVEPTPRDLALALNELVFDASPLSFVLMQADDAPEVAASYAIAGTEMHAFPPNLPPATAPAWIASGGFGSASLQTRGTMLVVTTDGPLEIPLENLGFTATTYDGCTRGTVSFTGVIPAANADLADRLTGEESEEEGEPGRDAPVDIMLHALFAIELVPFDFESLP